MTVDIVLPEVSIGYVMLATAWAVTGFLFSFVHMALRQYVSKWCLIVGFTEATIFVLGVSVINSIFTGRPFDIQMINITVGV